MWPRLLGRGTHGPGSTDSTPTRRPAIRRLRVGRRGLPTEGRGQSSVVAVTAAPDRFVRQRLDPRDSSRPARSAKYRPPPRSRRYPPVVSIRLRFYESYIAIQKFHTDAPQPDIPGRRRGRRGRRWAPSANLSPTPTIALASTRPAPRHRREIESREAPRGPRDRLGPTSGPDLVERRHSGNHLPAARSDSIETGVERAPSPSPAPGRLSTLPGPASLTSGRVAQDRSPRRRPSP